MKPLQITCFFILIINTTSFITPHQKSSWQQQQQQYHHRRPQRNPTSSTTPFITSTSTDTSLHDHAFLSSSLDLSAATTFLQGGASSLAHGYMELLRTKPLQTKAMTAAVLAPIGDAIAQFQSQKSYNPLRGAAFLVFGALYTGCFQHYWFDFLNGHIIDWGEALRLWGHPAETNIPVQAFVQQHSLDWWQYFDVKAQIDDVMNTLQAPPTDSELALAKVAVNQFLIVPTVYMPIFFAVTGLLGGLDIPKSIARAESLYLPIMKRNYFYWLPVQFFQFLVLPVDLQIPFVSAASLVWTIILSTIASDATTPAAAPATIVAYEEETQPAAVTTLSSAMMISPQEEDETIVTVVPVDAGAANTALDNVSLQDVTDALVPDAVLGVAETVGDALQDKTLGASASGLALGLLAAAADEGGIGAAVGGMLGAGTLMGSDGGLETSVGVAVVTAVGAGVGYLSAAAGGGSEEGVSVPSSPISAANEELLLLEQPPNDTVYSNGDVALEEEDFTRTEKETENEWDVIRFEAENTASPMFASQLNMEAATGESLQEQQQQGGSSPSGENMEQLLLVEQPQNPFVLVADNSTSAMEEDESDVVSLP